MSVKDLFNSRANKIVTKQHVEQLTDEVESKKYIERGVRSRETFVPKIDFSEPKYFARYGSAEKYYEDSIHYIFKTYPYDGSLAEKTKWHTQSSYLDNWFFENEYPRTTGYVDFNKAPHNPVITPHPIDPTVTWFTTIDNPQFVSFKGGPNSHIDKPYGSAAPDGKTDKLSELYPQKGGRANIWNDTEKYYELIRRTNLLMDIELGNTIEFWVKTGENPSGRVALFDMVGTVDDTRITIEHKPNSVYVADGGIVDPKLFMVTYIVEGVGILMEGIGDFSGLGSPESQTLNDPFSSAGWNHYAFVFSKFDDDFVRAELFINGEPNDSFSDKPGGLPQKSALLGLRANLNAYITNPAG